MFCPRSYVDLSSETKRNCARALLVRAAPHLRHLHSLLGCKSCRLATCRHVNKHHLHHRCLLGLKPLQVGSANITCIIVARLGCELCNLQACQRTSDASLSLGLRALQVGNLHGLWAPGPFAGLQALQWRETTNPDTRAIALLAIYLLLLLPSPLWDKPLKRLQCRKSRGHCTLHCLSGSVSSSMRISGFEQTMLC